MYIALLQPNLHDSKISRGHGQELKRSQEQTLGLNHGPHDVKIGLNSHNMQTSLRSLSLVSLSVTVSFLTGSPAA